MKAGSYLVGAHRHTRAGCDLWLWPAPLTLWTIRRWSCHSCCKLTGCKSQGRAGQSGQL